MQHVKVDATDATFDGDSRNRFGHCTHGVPPAEPSHSFRESIDLFTDRVHLPHISWLPARLMGLVDVDSG